MITSLTEQQQRLPIVPPKAPGSVRDEHLNPFDPPEYDSLSHATYSAFTLPAPTPSPSAATFPSTRSRAAAAYDASRSYTYAGAYRVPAGPHLHTLPHRRVAIAVASSSSSASSSFPKEEVVEEEGPEGEYYPSPSSHTRPCSHSRAQDPSHRYAPLHCSTPPGSKKSKSKGKGKGKGGKIVKAVSNGVLAIVVPPVAVAGAVLAASGFIIYGCGKLLEGIGKGIAVGPEVVYRAYNRTERAGKIRRAFGRGSRSPSDSDEVRRSEEKEGCVRG